METIGGLLVLAGLAVVGYALFRRFKQKDLAGKPLWKMLGVGLLVLFVGMALCPDEDGVVGGKDPLGELAKLPLASREEAGQLMPSPIGATLGDVYKTISAGTPVKVRRDGERLTLSTSNDRGDMEVEFSIADFGQQGRAAIVEGLTKEPKDGMPGLYEGAEAHAILTELLR